MTLGSTGEIKVGDAVKVRAVLTSPESDFQGVFWVKITEPEKSEGKGEKSKSPTPDDRIGLPQLVLVHKEAEGEGRLSWDKLEEEGIEMNHQTVMHPLVEGDRLERVYINMDSSVLKNHKSKIASADALVIAEKRYLSSVYFHTLFLYMITRNRKYTIFQERNGAESEAVDLTDYLKDIFDSSYSEFLLNFEMSQLIASLED